MENIVFAITDEDGSFSVCMKSDGFREARVERVWIDEDGELYILVKKKKADSDEGNR